MVERCRLAIDLAAAHGRVMAGLFDGRKLRLEEVHRFAIEPVRIAGTSRWNVLGVWSAILTGLSRAAARYGDRIDSVGVDTHGMDCVLMSKNFELLGQPWAGRDEHARGLIDLACNRVPRREIFAATGTRFQETGVLYRLLALKRDHPELLAVTDRVLMMPDFLHWSLCGSCVCEFTTATISQCFDPTADDWAIDLLRRFALPTTIFPPVVPAGTKLGRLREEVARETGLRRIDVIAPATHAVASEIAALPTSTTASSDRAFIRRGDHLTIGAEVREPVLTERASKANMTNAGGPDDTYHLSKDVAGDRILRECRRAFRNEGRRSELPEPTFNSLIDPDDVRFRDPPDMPQAIAAFCRETDQPVPTKPGEVIRCVLESLALKSRCVLGEIEEAAGTPVRTIHVVGKGSRDELLDRFLAGACGRPVITGPVEGAVMGNLLLQARAAGEIGSLAELREIIHRSSDCRRFEPEHEVAWRTATRRFAALCDRPA